MSERKITHGELLDLFAGEIPMEAMAFIFEEAPSDMTIAEVRARLKQMAEERNAPKLYLHILGWLGRWRDRLSEDAVADLQNIADNVRQLELKK